MIDMSNNCYISDISSCCLTTLSRGGRRGVGTLLDLLLEGGRDLEGAGPAAVGIRRRQEEASAGGQVRGAGRRRRRRQRRAAGGGGGAEGDGLHLHEWGIEWGMDAAAAGGLGGFGGFVRRGNSGRALGDNDHGFRAAARRATSAAPALG